MIIEIAIGLIVLSFFYFMLILVDKFKLKRLRKKYNENDDRSKHGESRRSVEGTIPRITESVYVPPRPDESEPGELLPPTSTVSDGETSDSSGETDGLTDFFKNL